MMTKKKHLKGCRLLTSKINESGHYGIKADFKLSELDMFETEWVNKNNAKSLKEYVAENVFNPVWPLLQAVVNQRV